MVRFLPVGEWLPRGKDDESVLAELEGALLMRRSVFPYFMLVALEAGGPLRALLLLLISPILSLLETIGLAAAALHAMIFISTAGLRVADVTGVARATLPRFFLQDMSEKVYGALSRTRGKKYVVTSMPRLMVEPFVWEYLDVERVVGTELLVTGGRCLGVAAPPGIMLGCRRLNALRATLGDRGEFDVGLGDGLSVPPFTLCKETYMAPPAEEASGLPQRRYPKPLIFHDGRLVARPTELECLAVLLWLPISMPLAAVRFLVGLVLPYRWHFLCCAALGLRIRAKFAPTALRPAAGSTLYACSHRTLLDPVVAATVLRRKLMAVTYSLSAVSEALSPIPTVRLTRDRRRDGEVMRRLLEEGDLVVCPEGTTCREPYLLRFSPLFAEVAEEIVPLAVTAEGSMFYGSTVRGYKCLDSIFFLMNPSPRYRLDFLDRVSGGVGSGQDVANRVQKAIAGALGFECTAFTRRDKYRMIAGSDGRVESRN